MYHHTQDTIVIMVEWNLPRPHCLACDMFVSWMALNLRQLSSDLCERGFERKRRNLAEEEARAGAAAALRAYDCPLETVSSFKYLGHLLTATENDWTAIISSP